MNRPFWFGLVYIMGFFSIAAAPGMLGAAVLARRLDLSDFLTALLFGLGGFLSLVVVFAGLVAWARLTNRRADGERRDV